MIRALTRFTRDGSGQTIVEFALAVVVLLVIVLGLFDVGRAVWYSNTLALATREGARYAIVHGSLSGSSAVATEAQVVTQVDLHATGLNPTPATTVTWCTSSPCVSPDPAANDPGDYVTVTSTLVYTPIASRVFIGGALNVTLRGSATMVMRN
jgi:Flp pilus assembly protein TadG